MACENKRNSRKHDITVYGGGPAPLVQGLALATELDFTSRFHGKSQPSYPGCLAQTSTTFIYSTGYRTLGRVVVGSCPGTPGTYPPGLVFLGKKPGFLPELYFFLCLRFFLIVYLQLQYQYNIREVTKLVLERSKMQ